LLGTDAGLGKRGRLEDAVLAMPSPAFHRELIWRAFAAAARANKPRLISPDGVV
jgi:hypothetical protein